MRSLWEIWHGVVPMLARSKALERWEGARAPIAKETESFGWFGYALVAGCVLAGVILLVLLGIHLHRRRHSPAGRMP